MQINKITKHKINLSDNSIDLIKTILTILLDASEIIEPTHYDIGTFHFYFDGNLNKTSIKKLDMYFSFQFDNIELNVHGTLSNMTEVKIPNFISINDLDFDKWLQAIIDYLKDSEKMYDKYLKDINKKENTVIDKQALELSNKLAKITGEKDAYQNFMNKLLAKDSINFRNTHNEH